MSNNEVFIVEGYFLDNPNHIHYMNVSAGEWDGIENHADNDIFFYMDNEPLHVGATISEDFVILSIEK